MNSRAKVLLPLLREMCLQMDYSLGEDTILHTLFSHAVTDPSILPHLAIISINQPVPELDSPFFLGELQVAISQGEPKSTPSYYQVKFQHPRNLPPHGRDALLHLANHSWDLGEIPDTLSQYPSPLKILEIPRIFGP